MGFCLKIAEKGPPVVREVCESLGWKIIEDDSQDTGFNLWWKTSRFTKTQIASCNPFQRLNHFPGTIEMTRKDLLHRNIRKMKGIHGTIAEFVPESYLLPKDYSKFVFAFSEAPKGTLWIAKPHDLSRGRKIFIFTELNELQYDQQYVLQRYLDRPLLIDGFKFDLRIYVLVTSFRPLRAYLYKQGLARFSTERYCLDTKDKFVHLTNASINKFNPRMMDEDGNSSGYKWTFDDLFEHFRTGNVCDQEALWDRIRNLVSITLLSIIDEVPSDATPCFELFGFDVMIDDSLKPWLLEVNFSPSLNLDTATDHIVKKPLLRDVISVLNLVDFDKDAFSTSSTKKAPLPSSQATAPPSSATLSSTSRSRSISAPRTLSSNRLRDSLSTTTNRSTTASRGSNANSSSSSSSNASGAPSFYSSSRRSEASIVQQQRESRPTSSAVPVSAYAEHGDLGNFEYLLPWDGPSREALQQCLLGRSDLGVRSLVQMFRTREQAAIARNKPFAKQSSLPLSASQSLPSLSAVPSTDDDLETDERSLYSRQIEEEDEEGE